MNDPLWEVVDEIGATTAGILWPAVRGQVMAWMRDNPVKADWLRRRIVAAVVEGRL